MSLFYLVDGYNVIKGHPAWAGMTLRKAREALVAFIEGHRPQGSARNRVLVVFDGSAAVAGVGSPLAVEVVFTRGESADDKIKDLVRCDPHPARAVVVTDDKALGRAVRPLGAAIMPTQVFLDKPALRGKRVVASGRGDEIKPELTIVERESITEELRRIWLKKRSS